MRKISLALFVFAIICFAGFAKADDNTMLMAKLGVADAQVLSNSDMNDIRGTTTYHVRIDNLIEGWPSYYYDWKSKNVYNTGQKLLNRMHIVSSSGSGGAYDTYVNDQNRSQVLFYVYGNQQYTNFYLDMTNIGQNQVGAWGQGVPYTVQVVNPSYIFPVAYLKSSAVNYTYNPSYPKNSTGQHRIIDTNVFATYMGANMPDQSVKPVNNTVANNTWLAPLTGSKEWDYSNWKTTTWAYNNTTSTLDLANQRSMRDQYRPSQINNAPMLVRNGWGIQ